MGDLLKKHFVVAVVQTNLWKVSICDTEQDPEGEHGTGGYRNSWTKLNKTVVACLMMICFHLLFIRNISVM